MQVIELEKHTFEMEGHKILSVRIGILVPHLYRKAFRKEPTPYACEGIIDFYIDELIGNFERKKGVSKYWAIDDSFDAADFQKSILNNVLPFFEKVHDLAVPHLLDRKKVFLS